ncbi:L-rhamnose isomerase, partial [Priestia megaterium]
CEKMDVPVKETWLEEVKQYEQDVLAKRYSVLA